MISLFVRLRSWLWRGALVDTERQSACWGPAMNRGIQVAIAAALGIGGSFLANSAQATPIPDQSQLVRTGLAFVGFSTSGTQTQLAQTFTVGISGILSRIDISLTKASEDATRDIVIDIRPTTSSGAPDPDDTHAFLTASVSPSSVLKFPGISLITFDISSSNFSVVAGDILAITISSTQSLPGQYNVGIAGDLLGGGGLYLVAREALETGAVPAMTLRSRHLWSPSLILPPI